jgi:hypothetical protein
MCISLPPLSPLSLLPPPLMLILMCELNGYFDADPRIFCAHRMGISTVPSGKRVSSKGAGMKLPV